MRLYISLVFAAASLALMGPAFAAESLAVTDYKKEVDRLVNQWAAQMKSTDDKLTKLKAELGPKNMIESAKDEMKKWSERLQLEIGKLDLKPANKNELAGLPHWLEDIIKAKGLPVSKNATLKVQASDPKAKPTTNSNTNQLPGYSGPGVRIEATFP